MRSVLWTDRALEDLAAIETFVGRNSPHYAAVVVARLVATAARLTDHPESGRAVPEYNNPSVRELVSPPYRIVYRLVGERDIHILTIHHGARAFPADL